MEIWDRPSLKKTLKFLISFPFLTIEYEKKLNIFIKKN